MRFTFSPNRCDTQNRMHPETMDAESLRAAAVTFASELSDQWVACVTAKPGRWRNDAECASIWHGENLLGWVDAQ